jgi:hypothetical protein
MPEVEEKKALSEEKKEEKKDSVKSADAAKADADAGTKLDRVLSCLDSMGKRMDSIEEMEKKRGDSAKKAADEWPDKDEKKKDAKKADWDEDDEEEEEGNAKRLAADKKKDSKRKDAKKADEHDEKIATDKKKDSKKSDDDDDDDDDSKKDSKKADSRADSLQRRVDELEAKLAPRGDADQAALADAQSRADSAFAMAGEVGAFKPLDGESVIGYRIRLLKKHQAKSPKWKDANLKVIAADSITFENAEKEIYDDSIAANTSPGSVGEGTLRMIRKSDETGRVHVSWIGQPRAWMSQFAPPTRRVVQIRTRSQDSF